MYFKIENKHLYLYNPREYSFVHFFMDLFGFEWFQVNESMGFSSWKII